MIRLANALRPLAKWLPLRHEFHFQTQAAAHRRFIASYKGSGHTDPTCIDKRPLFIGYFETEFGLGELVKGLASAMQAAGISFSAYPYNGFTGRARNEAPWASHYDVDNVHSVNIVVAAVDQTHNLRRIIGPPHFAQSYSIIVAPWELPRAPEAWRHKVGFFDEMWAQSAFVAAAYRPIFAKPIVIVPPCIDLSSDIVPNRQKFGLDANRFYFLFAFDFNSFPSRKNPEAILNAFHLSFGNRNDDVGLILKTSGTGDRYPGLMREIEAATVNDKRILVLRGDWKHADFLTLLASTDSYVSLHRSEGFGMGMAEAMLLGKPVIATGFSGNADFLTADTGYPVPYALRPVQPGEYPYSQGNTWAEPDLKAAAEMMRDVATRSLELQKRAAQGAAFVRQHYGPKAIGTLMASRLHQIAAARPSL